MKPATKKSIAETFQCTVELAWNESLPTIKTLLLNDLTVGHIWQSAVGWQFRLSHEPIGVSKSARDEEAAKKALFAIVKGKL